MSLWTVGSIPIWLPLFDPLLFILDPLISRVAWHWSQSAPESPVKLESKSSDTEYEDIKSMDEDSDTISFYSDDTDSDRMSKLSREDFSAVIDTDGDEGFYDKSETRRLVQWF